MKLRVFEAFSGIGAQAMALKRLFKDYPDKVEFEYVGTSEIEPTAIKAYEVVHGDVPCFGDITTIDWNNIPDFDIFTMSSPCQDFSVAGKQAGAEEGSGTRSALLWECRKAILAKKPRYILFENVAAVKNKKHIKTFNKWQHELESYGYTNFAVVLDSQDYGVAQHRERLFMVSILDCTEKYYFPKPFKLEKRLKDYLEKDVPESYYLKPEQVVRIVEYCDKKQAQDSINIVARLNSSQDGVVVDIDGCPPCLCVGHGNMPKIAEPQIGISIHPLNRKMEFNGYRSGRCDVAPTLTAHDGKGGEPCVWEVDACIRQLAQLYPDSGNPQAGRVYDINGVAPSIKTFTGGNSAQLILSLSDDNVDAQISNASVWVDPETHKAYYYKGGLLWRIRKLTPRECFRLQGVYDEDIDKIQTTDISKSAQYSLAGNSITIDVLYYIFRSLFVDKSNHNQQLTLF